ncbi:MAG: phosphotransferase family protein [Acidimicrobiia bacterium]
MSSGAAAASNIPDGLVERLGRWVARQSFVAGDGSIGPVSISGVSRPPAGQSNDTILFTVEWVRHGRTEHTDLVLRRQATGAAIFAEPDVLREARVLNGLASTPVPVPRIVWTESDPSVLDAPFFVMERVQGVVPLGKPSIHSVGVLPTLSQPQLRRLWDSAMDALVAVHAVDWRVNHSFLASGDLADPAQQLNALLEFYRWTADGRPYPITDAAVAKLTADVAGLSPREPVLVWGDARVGNMIFDADQHVAAVIDWELATIGPPELDLARWIFFDNFGTSAAGIERLPGWPSLDETLAIYQERSGRTLHDLGFYELMDELFMATTLIRQSDLYVSRGFAGPECTMGHANTATQMIARRLGLDVPELSPDYIAHRTPGAAKAIHMPAPKPSPAIEQTN